MLFSAQRCSSKVFIAAYNDRESSTDWIAAAGKRGCRRFCLSKTTTKVTLCALTSAFLVMVSRFLAMRALQPNLSDDSNDDEESQLLPNSSATILQPMHPQYYQVNHYSAQGSFSFHSDDDEESQLPLRVEGQLSHAPPSDDTLSIKIEASADASLLALPEIINIPHFDERQCMCKQITPTTASSSEIRFAGLAYAGFDPKVQQINKHNQNVL